MTRSRRVAWGAGLSLVVLLLLAGTWMATRPPPPMVRTATREAHRPAAKKVHTPPRASRPAPIESPAPSPPDDVVEEDDEPPETAFFGRVRGAERLGDGDVFVEGCGMDRAAEGSAIDQNGGFFHSFQSRDGRETCSMRAWRRHGALRMYGDWVQVPTTGGEVDVVLDIPTYAPAGMGIGFRPTVDGVMVETIHPGSPAADAGLAVGDRITVINGTATMSIGVEDFLAEGIGPEGSEVELYGVTADGEVFHTTFARRPIVD